MGSPKRSLIDYAEANPTRRGGECAVCSWPERQEIDAGFRAGLRATAILRWLIAECGYGRDVATPGKLGYHYRQEHHVGS